MTSYSENQIDKSEQFSSGTDNDNLADIEEDKPLKRKKLKKKSMKSEQFSNGTDQDNDNKEDKPLKIKKLKKKSMKVSNETAKGGFVSERPFSCNLCSMTFIQKGHLTNHEIHKHKANKN